MPFIQFSLQYDCSLSRSNQKDWSGSSLVAFHLEAVGRRVYLFTLAGAAVGPKAECGLDQSQDIKLVGLDPEDPAATF